jgi:TMEM175 potassium channel family protein
MCQASHRPDSKFRPRPGPRQAPHCLRTTPKSGVSKLEEPNTNKPILSKQSQSTAQPPSHGATKFEYLRALDPAPKTRAEILADGIFAVAMTILVLDIRLLPLAGDISNAQYLHSVLALWPKVIVFVASFIALGRLWQLHRNIFHFVERSDQQLLFWNLLSLMFLCLLPFRTSVAGEHPDFSLSAGMYAGNVLMLNLVYRGMWHHASYEQLLLRNGFDPAIGRVITRTFNVDFVLILTALGLSCLNSLLSIGLIVVHQLVMFFGPPMFKGRQV